MPLVLKPNDTGSTVGLTILKENSEDAFNKAIDLALAYSKKALIEEFIEGRELTVGVLGNTALPIIEITTAGDAFYDYHHKYTPGMSFHTVRICRPNLPPQSRLMRYAHLKQCIAVAMRASIFVASERDLFLSRNQHASGHDIDQPAARCCPGRGDFLC